MKRTSTAETIRRVTGLLATLAAGSLLVAVTIAAVSPAGAEPQSDYQLLFNPGVETYDSPYDQWFGVDCQVASGWQRFSTGDLEPCWMDTRVFAESWLGSGWVERMEGQTSQLLVSTQPYTAGLRQTVTGLTPGVGYGFHAAMLTIFQSSALPPEHGTMIKQLGLDPTGGTDPQAPSVVWSPANNRDKWWDIQNRVATTAQSPTMTVFIRVDSLLEAGPWPFMNLSFLDSAILAQTPAVTATSPPVSEVTLFIVAWDNLEMPPGDAQFRGIDVQWLDEAEGAWHPWITQTLSLEAAYEGEPGHTYHFRARAWASYPNGAWLHGPYRDGGDTATLVSGPRLMGRVLSPDGLPVPGATVAISGTGYAAQTGADGLYELYVEALGEPQAATVNHSWWASPPPKLGLTIGLTETVGLTWTLRAPADAVGNGQFEDGMAGWVVVGDAEVPPLVVAEPVHTGLGSLQLGGTAPTSFTTGVSQTVALTGAWEPALSLWYQPGTCEAEARFNVVVVVSGQSDGPGPPISATSVLTPDLGAHGWRPLWATTGPPGSAFTGTVTVELRLWADGPGEEVTVYVDEVSLGATPGGRHHVSLPMVLR
jgi:hypothetical protein